MLEPGATACAVAHVDHRLVFIAIQARVGAIDEHRAEVRVGQRGQAELSVERVGGGLIDIRVLDHRDTSDCRCRRCSNSAAAFHRRRCRCREDRRPGPRVDDRQRANSRSARGFDTRCTSGLLCSRLSRPWIDSTTDARSAGTLGSLVLEYRWPSVLAAIFTPKTFCACAMVPVNRDLARRGVGGLDGESFFLEPSRDARKVGVGRAEATGEGVGSQPSMVLR